jgi:hypothetical protein
MASNVSRVGREIFGELPKGFSVVAAKFCCPGLIVLPFSALKKKKSLFLMMGPPNRKP